MNISLPAAIKQWVLEQVASGKYTSASDYMRQLIRRDQERPAATPIELYSDERIGEFEHDDLALGAVLRRRGLKAPPLT